MVDENFPMASSTPCRGKIVNGRRMLIFNKLIVISVDNGQFCVGLSAVTVLFTDWDDSIDWITQMKKPYHIYDLFKTLSSCYWSNRCEI
jgi:hypothetical protein